MRTLMPDFSLTFDVPHSLGVARAADELRDLNDLQIVSIETESEGTVDIPGPGVVKLNVKTKITGDIIHVVATGDKPFHVFDRWIKDAILSKVKEALK
jgi:hypothetical protein